MVIADGSAPALEIYTRSWPALARAHLAVRGTLNGATGAQLAEEVDAVLDRDHTVILDLSEVAEIDAAGVQAIKDCERQAVGLGAELFVQDPSPVARLALRA